MFPTGAISHMLTGPLYACLGRALVWTLPLAGLGVLAALLSALRLRRP